MTSSLAKLSLIASGVSVAILLVGCSTHSTVPKSTVTATVAPSATPTSTAQASDVLFTISANVRAVDGSTVGILMTVHAPIPHSSAAAKPLEDSFIGACGSGKGGMPRDAAYLAANGSMVLPVDIAASTTGKTFASPVGLNLGSPYFGAAVSGKNLVPADATAPCYNGYRWITSGTVKAVSEFESGIPGPNLRLWRYGLYGFGVADGSNATIEACKITITPLGKADDVASVAGWDATAPQSGLTCVIGYSGE